MTGDEVCVSIEKEKMLSLKKNNNFFTQIVTYHVIDICVFKAYSLHFSNSLCTLIRILITTMIHLKPSFQTPILFNYQDHRNLILFPCTPQTFDSTFSTRQKEVVPN